MPFGFGRPDARSPSAAVQDRATPNISFAAFSADCRISGGIALRAERLTDLVNGTEPLDLRGVVVEALTDSRRLDVGDLTVERDELCVVVVDGPRGNPARRLMTRTRAVEVRVGPYHVEAAVHGTPASDPMARVARGPAFVPLTDAALSYELNGEHITESHPVLLVNRHLTRTFRATDDARELVAHEVS